MTLTLDRAHAINRTLIDAYLVRCKMMPGEPPSFCGFTVAEAVAATEMLRDRPCPVGAGAFAVWLPPESISEIYAWSVLQSEETP